MKSIREAGYLLLTTPRSGVMPLDLLYKSEKGVLSRYEAPIYELFISKKQACPLISDETRLPTDITTEEDLSFSFESNVRLLDALAQLIRTKLSAKVNFDKHSKVALRLNEPKSHEISLLQLDKFLQTATIDKNAASTVKKLFNGDLYVITEIIKSKSFTVVDKNASQMGVEAVADAPGITTASVDLSSGKGKQGSVTYDGDEYLTFAVMASRIVYDKPGLFSKDKGIFELKKAGDIVFVRGNEKLSTERLTMEDGFVNV